MTPQRRGRRVAESERAKATARVEQAHALLAEERSEEAESLLRSALANMRRAYLWDDRNPLDFRELHRLGLEIHDRFGCQLPFHNGAYHEECPVLLAHSRLGFSIGGTGESLCSICGESPFECPHVTGETYDEVEARRLGSFCNICLAESGCEHEIEATYDGVEAIRIVTQYRLDEISLVEEPANPDAVILSRTLTDDDIRSQLPKEEQGLFTCGETPIFCHHCASCDGTA